MPVSGKSTASARQMARLPSGAFRMGCAAFIPKNGRNDVFAFNDEKGIGHGL